MDISDLLIAKNKQEYKQEQFHSEGVRVEANLPGTFTALAMHNKKMFGLENLGQGHEEQPSQWYHSMANINCYKTRGFFASSHRVRDIHITQIS